jgi:hypothetical protein
MQGGEGEKRGEEEADVRRERAYIDTEAQEHKQHMLAF